MEHWPKFDTLCLWTTVNAGPSCLFLFEYLDALSCSAIRSPGDRGCGGETDLNRAVDGSAGGGLPAACTDAAASIESAERRCSPLVAPSWSEPEAW